MKREMSTVVAATLVFCGGLAIAGSLRDQPKPAQAAVTVQAPPPISAPLFTEAVNALGKSAPTSLTIPAIGVKNAPISPVGLNADQSVEVPPLSKPNLVGWYKHRPTPGEQGAAVLLGHVDGYGKPAVFYKAHTLKAGDTISVKRKDASTATFSVDSLERVDKDAFPTDKVYGATDAAELRLVTCGGEFDAATGHYKDNVIVYAHLVN
ncbi:class F sortase [Nonomuraea sp. NPDC050556]|uniref:class F sortase n=1 Tax=Nonomuraea sp. NPDC050556 TaxID=3364369 RepID=UPI0037A8C389